MIVYVLVMWFGFANTQSSFAVPGIASLQECQRLGKEMAKRYGNRADCYAYRKARP